MPDSLTFRHLKKGYTLHVHTAVGGKKYNLHVYMLAAEMDTHCARASLLLVVERNTPCTSILLAVEMYTLRPYC